MNDLYANGIDALGLKIGNDALAVWIVADGSLKACSPAKSCYRDQCSGDRTTAAF
jgi:hypothetical protein